ncbi:restriction alleviation protein lar [Caudoviricetes sp.]|nr:restriction alleviation protein lar [Caudoviricetes sp.]
MTQSTKSCPICGNENLLRLPSQNKKICTDHDAPVHIPWFLNKNQKPLIKSQR